MEPLVLAGQATARLLEVIEVEDSRGAGIEGDPIRTLHRYFSLDGTLLAERDDFQGEQAEKVHVFRLHGADIFVPDRAVVKFAQMKCDSLTEVVDQSIALGNRILALRTVRDLTALQAELSAKEKG